MINLETHYENLSSRVKSPTVNTVTKSAHFARGSVITIVVSNTWGILNSNCTVIDK